MPEAIAMTTEKQTAGTMDGGKLEIAQPHMKKLPRGYVRKPECDKCHIPFNVGDKVILYSFGNTFHAECSLLYRATHGQQTLEGSA